MRIEKLINSRMVHCNLVARVSLLPTPWNAPGGRKNRDPGNEVECTGQKTHTNKKYQEIYKAYSANRQDGANLSCGWLPERTRGDLSRDCLVSRNLRNRFSFSRFIFVGSSILKDQNISDLYTTIESQFT